MPKMTVHLKKTSDGKITETMSSKRRSRFPVKHMMMLTFTAIACMLYLDIKEHGSWNDSLTRNTLKEYRVCEFACLALNKTKEGLVYVDGRIEEAFPTYHKTVKVLSEPYIELAVNLGKMARNGVSEMKDALLDNDSELFRFLDVCWVQSKRAVSDVFSSSVVYFNKSIDFLRKEVFVGQLSPENVQKVVVQAFNTTQQKAVEYYHWIYEKVQTSIK